MSRSRHRLRSALWYSDFAGLYRSDWRDNRRALRRRQARNYRRMLWRERDSFFSG